MKSKKINIHSILLLLVIIALPSCSNDKDLTERDVGFSVIPGSFQFPAEGGEQEVKITSNSTWTVSGSANWLSFSENSSEGNADLRITAQANEERQIRTAIVSVTGEDITRLVQIAQQKTEEPTEVVDAYIPPDNSNMRDLSAIQLAKEISIGWNLGNSLEAIGGETAWGNPVVSKRLIDSVKAAGFNAVRIPVAWSKFSNASTYTIEDSWMNRVEEVVNYVLENDMYAIINIHWDNGWMIPTYAREEEVNNRLEAMWKQIAINFRDYDDYLLFAGTNEVMVKGDYGTPTEEYYTVQNGYNQTFVNTVRATGGRNAFRHLVVQGFNTNIDYTVKFAEIPEDEIKNRLMMEIHYYDPFNFTLNENSDVFQWGEDAPDSEAWANEPFVDEQFLRMKNNFIDAGVAVILGEYGAIWRSSVAGHEAYREYYLKYITQSAMKHGLVPFYWDNGNAGNHGFAIFDRATGEMLYPDIAKALTAAGVN